MGAYARVGVTYGPTNWGAYASQPTNGYAVTNLIAITFVQASAAWGTLTYGGVFDGSGGGANLLAYGLLTTQQTINTGDTFQVPIQALVIQNN